MKDRNIAVVTRRKPHILNQRFENGAVSRLIAWQEVHENIHFFDFKDDELERVVNLNPEKWSVVLDLTGENAIFIIRAKLKLKRISAVCFRQDSQFRYYYSKFFHDRNIAQRFKSLINATRGVWNEFLCWLLFRSVGYVSEKDFLIQRGSYALRLLYVNHSMFERNLVASGLGFERIRVVGNFQYGPNFDGLMKLLECPEIEKVCQKWGMKFIFSGFGSLEFIEKNALKDRSIVDESASGPFETLSDLKQDNQMMICPSFYGAGVKNKLIEAQAIGAIAIAWDGLQGEYPYCPNWVAFAKDTNEFAQMIDFFNDQKTKLTKDESLFIMTERYKLKKLLEN